MSSRMASWTAVRVRERGRGALAGDLGGVDNVLEDGVLDGGEGAGAGTGGGRAGGALEGLEKLVGDVEDDGLLAGTAVDLLGGGDVEVLEGALKVVGGHLEVEDLLGDLELELVGAAAGLANLTGHCCVK